MKKAKRYTLCKMLLILGNALQAQTLHNKDLIVYTNLTDNLTGRYNIGIEYFLPAGKSKNNNLKASVAINGGLLATNPLQDKIKGANINLEANLYTDIMLPMKWNEFGGIKLTYGSFRNTTTETNYQSYFLGISTGIQPVVAKSITIRVSSDIGYIHNGLTNTLIFANRTTLLYSGFLVNANLGIGIRI